MMYVFRFFFKQKTAYEVRISDWSSDVCSSDLVAFGEVTQLGALARQINAAAARAPPAICRVGALDDFHAFQIEDFACLAARIAQAVYIHVVARGAAPNKRAIRQQIGRAHV